MDYPACIPITVLQVTCIVTSGTAAVASCYMSLLPGSLSILLKRYAFYVSSRTVDGESMTQNIATVSAFFN